VISRLQRTTLDPSANESITRSIAGWRAHDCQEARAQIANQRRLRFATKNSVRLASSAANLVHASLNFRMQSAAALSPVRPHGDHGIDAPGPMLGDATAVLNADGADLDIQAVIFEDDAVVVVRLWMNDFAEVQIHLVRYQKSVSKRELAGQ